MTSTLAVMVASDAFFNPKHLGQTKTVVPSIMQYLGSKLGVTHSDIVSLSSKLASQISEAQGQSGGSDLSRKRSQAADNSNDPDKKKKKKEAKDANKLGKKRPADES